MMTEKTRSKMENFLYYHKGSIVMVCLIIALLIYGGFIYKSEPKPIIYGEILNQTVEERVIQEVCDRAIKKIGKKPIEQRILVGTGLRIDVKHPEKNSASGVLENMTSQIFSHELDFLVGPPEIMDYYAKLGGLYNLDEWEKEEKNLGFSLIKSENRDGTIKYYGVDISKTAFGSKNSKTVFCILKNSERKEKAKIFLESLLQEEQ